MSGELLEALERLRRELVAELAEQRKEMAILRERLTEREEWFVGWKEIASYLGYSVDHAQDLGHSRHQDPVPHVKQGGTVAARKTLLDAWLFRRRQPAQRVVRRHEEPRRAPAEMPLFNGPRRGRADDGSAS